MAQYRRIKEVVGAMAELEALAEALDVEASKMEAKVNRVRGELAANREQRKRIGEALNTLGKQ